jgi:hypothetical protein
LILGSKNELFSDPAFMKPKLFVINYPCGMIKKFQENEKIVAHIVNDCIFYYGYENSIINVTNIVKNFRLVFIPENKNNLFTDPLINVKKYIYITHENELVCKISQHDFYNIRSDQRLEYNYVDDKCKIDVTNLILYKNNVIVVFICHDNSSLEFVANYLNNDYYYIIFVGFQNINEKYVNHPKIIIARYCAFNIENEYRLLTFTAWYAIIKNNLFPEAEYLCVLEYDVILNEPNFLECLKENIYNKNMKVYSFTTYPREVLQGIDRNTFIEFLTSKKCDINTIDFDFRWNPTTNHCIHRKLLNDFVEWYYPDCLNLKEKDLTRFSYYHERMFAIYLQLNKINYHHIYGVLIHCQNNSHLSY